MFVSRDDSGKINGAYAASQKGFAEEWLPADSKELRDFYQRLEA